MQKIEINMGDMQHKLLIKFAAVNHMEPEQYATNIIVGWLNSHIEGSFQKKMKAKSYDELKEILGEPEP